MNNEQEEMGGIRGGVSFFRNFATVMRLKTKATSPERPRRNGVLALSPLLVMAVLFVALGLLLGDFGRVSLPMVFVLTAVYALFTLRGLPLESRITVFSRGAGESDLLLMVWIFIFAGAFAASAKAMGAVEATVNLTLSLLPPWLILPGLFLSACLISLAIGTSVGTTVALTPIAMDLAAPTGLSAPLLVAAAVGGAFFGDNLSFISDTTVVATRTQGCRMRDKFRTNLWIALPAATVTFLIYMYVGQGASAEVGSVGEANGWLVLPYAVVLALAIAGINVLSVLALGVVLTGAVGLLTGRCDVASWLSASGNGILGMSETILVALLAGGLLAVIRRGGGITWVVRGLTQRVRTARGAELSIAALVSLTNLCTANNTVAILSVGTLAKAIAQKFGVDPRRTASLLDTFSCCVQGLIPYGAQLLIASGLAVYAGTGAHVRSTEIIPYLFYPVLLGVSALVWIFLKGRKSHR